MAVTNRRGTTRWRNLHMVPRYLVLAGKFKIMAGKPIKDDEGDAAMLHRFDKIRSGLNYLIGTIKMPLTQRKKCAKCD